jgi:hypothetical protein
MLLPNPCPLTIHDINFITVEATKINAFDTTSLNELIIKCALNEEYFRLSVGNPITAHS